MDGEMKDQKDDYCLYKGGKYVNKGSKLTHFEDLGLRESQRCPQRNVPLVIIAIMRQFDVFHILIDGGSSCDIMYSKLFGKMGIDIWSLWPYKGSNLQAFNGFVTCPRGYIELMISIGNGKDL